MAPFRPLCILVCATLIASLAACGGGSGATPAPPASAALLSGSYFLWETDLTDATPDSQATFWGVGTADGMGGLTGTIGANDGGAVIGPLALASSTYTVAGNRESTFVLFGTDGFAGWSNAAGSLALGANVTTGRLPGLFGMIRLGTGFSVASLQGDYFMQACDLVSPSGAMEAIWGSINFDGMGGGTFALTINDETAVGPTSDSLTYTVAANGQLTMTFTSGTVVEGALLQGGDLLLASGDVSGPSGTPLAVACVRKTSGASNATFNGTYQLIGLERDGGGFAAITGSAVSAGTGTLTATFTKNTDGLISSSGPAIVTYAAAADGGLIVDGTGEPLIGGCSPGGTYAIFAGPNAAMTNPRFYVLMRR